MRSEGFRLVIYGFIFILLSMEGVIEHEWRGDQALQHGFEENQRFQLFLAQLRERVEGLCPPNTPFAVESLGFGPDGGGIPTVRIQGEYCARIRQVFGHQVMVSPFTEYEYKWLRKQHPAQQPMVAEAVA